MAEIDAAILASNTAQPTGSDVQVPPALDPAQVMQPEISEGQTRYLKEQRAKQADLERKNAAIDKAQADIVGEEEAARIKAAETAEANKTATLKAAEATLKNLTRIGRRADTSIGSVPTPGSIVVPLVLLLLLFLVLIQVAGFSRLQWLLLVLTGNATVQPGAATTLSTPAQSSSTGTALAVQPVSPATGTVLTPLVAHTQWSGSGMVGGLY